MNPLKAMMNNSLNVLNIPSSPQQMLMNMLRQQKPQAYNQLQMLMSSGQNPQKLCQMYLSQLTPSQKNTLQQIANQYGVTTPKV